METKQVTIVIPISRKKFLQELFLSLDALECDLDNTSLFLYIDGGLDLLEKVKLYFAACKFRKKEYHYRAKGVGSVSGVRRRRERIAQIHNEMKTRIPESDYLFLIEDDTIVPYDSLTKLLHSYDKYPDAGFISGIELGRWGFPIIGAWKKSGDIIKSVAYQEEGLEEVDAAGFYCMLTKYDYYFFTNFKPFEKILGPDVSFGLELDGTKRYIDYSIKCVHLTEKEPLVFDEITPIQVVFTRDQTSRFGWQQKVIADEKGCDFC